MIDAVKTRPEPEPVSGIVQRAPADDGGFAQALASALSPTSTNHPATRDREYRARRDSKSPDGSSESTSSPSSVTIPQALPQPQTRQVNGEPCQAVDSATTAKSGNPAMVPKTPGAAAPNPVADAAWLPHPDLRVAESASVDAAPSHMEGRDPSARALAAGNQFPGSSVTQSPTGTSIGAAPSGEPTTGSLLAATAPDQCSGSGTADAARKNSRIRGSHGDDADEVNTPAASTTERPSLGEPFLLKDGTGRAMRAPSSISPQPLPAASGEAMPQNQPQRAEGTPKTSAGDQHVEPFDAAPTGEANWAEAVVVAQPAAVTQRVKAPDGCGQPVAQARGDVAQANHGHLAKKGMQPVGDSRAEWRSLADFRNPEVAVERVQEGNEQERCRVSSSGRSEPSRLEREPMSVTDGMHESSDARPVDRSPQKSRGPEADDMQPHAKNERAADETAAASNTSESPAAQPTRGFEPQPGPPLATDRQPTATPVMPHTAGDVRTPSASPVADGRSGSTSKAATHEPPGITQRYESSTATLISSSRMVDNLAHSEIRIAMQTESFGRVEIRTVLHDNRLGTAIGVGDREVQSLLRTELPALQQALNDRDLRVDDLHVFERSSPAISAFSYDSNSQSFSAPEPHEAMRWHSRAMASGASQNLMDGIDGEAPRYTLSVHA